MLIPYEGIYSLTMTVCACGHQSTLTLVNGSLGDALALSTDVTEIQSYLLFELFTFLNTETVSARILCAEPLLCASVLQT